MQENIAKQQRQVDGCLVYTTEIGRIVIQVQSGGQIDGRNGFASAGVCGACNFWRLRPDQQQAIRIAIRHYEGSVFEGLS